MQFQGFWFCVGFLFFLFSFFLFAGNKKEVEGINKPAFRMLQEKPM